MTLFGEFIGKAFSSLNNFLDKAIGESIDDQIFNHLDPFGYAKPLADYEKEDMTQEEIDEYNNARNEYNREHKDEIRENREEAKRQEEEAKETIREEDGY